MDPKKASNLLTPEEVEEAYKSWQYFKKSRRELTDQWKKFWAKKLLESYTAEEKTEEQIKSEEKTTKQEAEKKLLLHSPILSFKTGGFTHPSIVSLQIGHLDIIKAQLAQDTKWVHGMKTILIVSVKTYFTV